MLVLMLTTLPTLVAGFQIPAGQSTESGRYPSTSRARRRASVAARAVMTSSPARRASVARGSWMDEDKGNLDRKLRLTKPLSGGSRAGAQPPT